MKKNSKIKIFIFVLGVILSLSIFSHKNLAETSNPKENDNIRLKSSKLDYNGVPICTASDFQYRPKICSDGNGGAIITWDEYRGAPYRDIYAQRINSTGDLQWGSDGIAICTAFRNQESPELCSDGNGGAIITWQDFRTTYKYDIYAQRINSTGDVQWDPNGIAICTATYNQKSPKICSDGDEGAIITWEHYNSASDNDIYAQRVNSTGDIQWAPNGVAICEASYDQESPRLCSDGDEGAIITWEDSRAGPYYNIYARRINSTGDVQWDPDGIRICTMSFNQRRPKICPDKNGGAIIIWEDYRAGSVIYTYVQKINSTGDVQWSPSGTRISTNILEFECFPQISEDEEGGAIITWVKGYVNILAQRINSTGDYNWTSPGVAICTESGVQSLPQICSDGNGGAVIAWEDFRGGSYSDIYAQCINSTGDVQWDSGGMAISLGGDDQRYVQLCSDGAEGAIITWEDWRLGHGIYSEIYTQRINSTGSLKWAINIPDDGGGGGGGGGGGDGGGGEAIPGYNIPIIFGVIAIISVIVAEIHRKKKIINISK